MNFFNPYGGFAASEALRRHLDFKTRQMELQRQEQHFQQQMNFDQSRQQMIQDQWAKQYEMEQKKLAQDQEKWTKEKQKMELELEGLREQFKMEKERYDYWLKTRDKEFGLQEKDAETRRISAEASRTRGEAAKTRAASIAAGKGGPTDKNSLVAFWRKAYNASVERQVKAGGATFFNPYKKDVDRTKMYEIAKEEANRATLPWLNDMNKISAEDPTGSMSVMGLDQVEREALGENADDPATYIPPDMQRMALEEFGKLVEKPDFESRMDAGELTEDEESLLRLIDPELWKKYLPNKGKAARRKIEEEAAAKRQKEREKYSKQPTSGYISPSGLTGSKVQ